MTIPNVPTVGEDATALVLSVLRDTVRAHEATIAALTEAALGHVADVEYYQREQQRLSQAHYAQTNRLKDLVHAERVQGMRFERERNQVLDVLRALVTAIDAPDETPRDLTYARHFETALDTARDLVARIDARTATPPGGGG